MLRLVEADGAATRQADGRAGSPALLGDLGEADAAGAERAEDGLEVVAHEVEVGGKQAGLGGRRLRRVAQRVERGLGRRQAEDQPAAAGVDGGQLEDVAEEGSIGLRVGAVEEDVGAVGADLEPGPRRKTIGQRPNQTSRSRQTVVLQDKFRP